MTDLAQRDEKWRNHIQKMVEAAPPLTPEQIETLAALFAVDTEPDGR